MGNKNEQLNLRIKLTIDQIKEHLGSSLTEQQLSTIQTIITKNLLQTKHATDIRGRIHLPFLKFYYVFFLGLDKRKAKQDVSYERRTKTKFTQKVIFFSVVFIIILCISFFIYLLSIIPSQDIYLPPVFRTLD